MAYRINEIPSPKAIKEEMADYWEVTSIKSPDLNISNINISRSLSAGMDEFKHDGIESEDDLLNDSFDDVYKELSERKIYCNTGYPFAFGEFSIKHTQSPDYKNVIYLFLLFSTRLNMLRDKIQNNVDATLVFEEICAEVAKNYFGNNADSMVFGTACSTGSFEERVRFLIDKLGEGDSFKNANGISSRITKKDDGIDVVVWKNFADQREGKLIGFAQCKTGTNWKDSIHKLKPKDFCDNWFINSPILTPVPIVFLCDTLYENSLTTDQRGFLVFNRFRIMEYLPDSLNPGLLEKIKTWVEGAMKKLH